MAHDFSSFDARSKEITDWLAKGLGTIRTGRATPTLLDGVQVNSYGAKVPIQQVGSVGVEDPMTLRISVWDASQVQAVERAIIDADLGLSVVTDDRGLRVIFPQLTGERREQLLKLAKVKLEEARVSIRGARDEAIKKLEASDAGDDEKFRAKEDLQKRVDTANDACNKMFSQKEQEIAQ